MVHAAAVGRPDHCSIRVGRAKLGNRYYDDSDDAKSRATQSVRAAEYVRMSTDHQKYSTENQAEAIRQYAAARGVEIVRTYTDAGKSGLKIDGRDALKQLIDDVQTGAADFAMILVYGLRRPLIDESGAVKGVLSRGEHKSIQTDRVILTPGPDEEIAIIRGVYEAFVHERHSERDIAEYLNAQGIVTDLERPWTRGTVHQLLINEKYVGDNVWNRQSFKLKKKRVRNDPGMWIRAQGVFQAIIERDLFEAARSIIGARSFRLSDEEMIVALKSLYERQGQLSGLIIDECDGLPSSSAYNSRFGSLLRAYSLVGFTPHRDYRYVAINRALRKLHPDILREVIQGLNDQGSVTVQDLETDSLIINDEFSVSVVIVRCTQTATGLLRWKIRFEPSRMPDITIVVRMDTSNDAPFDYYLFPRMDVVANRLRLAEDNSLCLDAYRFETLDFLYDIAAPVKISEAA
ncbi:MAG: recombinase family protein [Usitatibacteraceae bacterium]